MVNYQTTGDNKHILDQYRQANTIGQQTRDALVNDAGNYAGKSKDQIKYINEQVQALERLNKIKYQQAQTGLQDSRNDQLNSLSDEARRRGLTGQASVNYISTRAKEITSNHSDDSRVIREQFNEAKTQTSQLRSVVDTIRITGKEEILSAKGNANVIASRIQHLEKSTDPNDRAVASYMKAYAPEPPKSQLSILAQASAAALFSAVQKGVVQMAGSKNAYDMVRPAMNTVGGLAGGLTQALLTGAGEMIGTAADAKKYSSKISKGVAKGATLLSELMKNFAPEVAQGVKTAFDVVGEEKARNLEAQQDTKRNILKTKAITGKAIDVSDMSKMGLTYQEVALKQGETAKAYGSAKDIESRTKNIANISKGVGIGEDTLMEFAAIQRNTDKSVISTIGGILTKGQDSYFKYDRSFLGEFTQKFLGLQKELLKTSTRVSDATTYDIMSTFNKLGGQWATNDSRSMSNIATVQNSLSNPQSEALDAMSYGVLRKLNPNAGPADLQMMKEAGLKTPGYAQGMLTALSSNGGDSDYKRLSIAGGMGGLNMAAATELYEGKDNIINAKIGQGALINKKGEQYFQNEAEQNTNETDSFFAGITNGFVKSAEHGFDEIAENFLKVIKEAFGDATIIPVANGSIRMNQGGVVGNATKTNKK